MKFSAVFVAATALVAGVTADYATVKADIKKIQTDVGKLYAALKATSGTSYQEAIAIDTAARALNKTIATANKDAKAVASVTIDQGKAILSILSSTYTNVSLTSKRLIALQPAWKKLGIAAIVKADIGIIQTQTKSFGATLVSKAPSSLKSSASALASKYNAALASAYAAYA